ncbi:MAG: hypothetical protein KDE51_24465 [Anaerolineales bacterium]|nr:hypothetical protein [Anaerolineales bacterium]
MNWFSSNTPLILGHRGASADAPENTLKAFKLAIAQGAAGFEFDVQLSADGVPVVIHDHKVNRTTNGSGSVHKMTLEELKKLDAGEGETILTLEEVFKTFGDQILYNIEIKDDSWRNQGTEAAVGRLIKQYGVQTNCLVTSFNPMAMRRGRDVIPAETPMGMIRMMVPQKYSYHLFSGQADHPHYWLVTPEYMKWAAKRGYRIHVWTVDDPAIAKRLTTLGVHGLITNKPQFIREQLAL